MASHLETAFTYMYCLILQLYNRHALYLASQVGSGFDPMVSSVWYTNHKMENYMCVEGSRKKEKPVSSV